MPRALAAALSLTLSACTWFPAPREPPYELLATWGRPGAGPGEFNEPTGIAVAGDAVYVSDARNARIQVFDRNGNFRRAFGGPELGRPMNLTIAAGELFVADYWYDRVHVYGLDGALQRSLGGAGSGPGELDAPGGMAVGPDGDLYVADFYNQRVQRLHRDGSFVRQWGETRRTGSAPGRFNYPTDVAVASDGTLYVADGYNDRVQVFAADGMFVRKWGGPLARNVHGPFNGWFATVTSIALARDGSVFVADFYNDRVQKFSAEGDFLTTFGIPADGPSHTAMAVAVAEDDTVFVTDVDHHRVQKWRPAAKGR